MVHDGTETQVLVIGGGPGGYVAAIRAGQLGLDVTLVERQTPGGTCINRGCIPSKALLSATDLAHRAGHAEDRGIRADPTVDLGTTIDWKDGIVEQLTEGIERLCSGADVRLVDGSAEFVDEQRARIVHPDDTVEPVAFDHAIVATGSRPIELPGFDYADPPVMDAGAALDRREIPDRLVVVGAGYIGMELSTVFARLGSDVTVIEALDSVLPGWEDQLTRPVRTAAKQLGIDFHFGELAAGWEPIEDGIVVQTDTEEGETSEYPADAVLVAVGRTPVTDTVGLEAIGVEPDDDGYLPTDDQCRTTHERLFAVGDVAGEPMLAHKASAEGEVAAEVIAGESASMADRVVPAVVYTEPEIATVGLSADAAEAAGHDPVTGRFLLRASGRAMTLDATDGFVRIVADSDTGTVLGGQAVGPEASELIAEIGLAVEAALPVQTVADTIHAHPTLAEATMEAAKQADGRAIHTGNR